MKLENMEEYECDGGGGAKPYYLCDTAVFGIPTRLEIPKYLLEECSLDGLFNGKKIQKYLDELILGLNWNPKFSIGTIESMAILNAHGIYDMPGWNYEDKSQGSWKERPVQSWIDEHDGKYNLLLTCSCNPHREDNLKSNKSILIYPSGDIVPEPDSNMQNPDFLVRYDPEECIA